MHTYYYRCHIRSDPILYLLPYFVLLFPYFTRLHFIMTSASCKTLIWYRQRLMELQWPSYLTKNNSITLPHTVLSAQDLLLNSVPFNNFIH